MDKQPKLAEDSFDERLEVYSALRDEAIRLQGEQNSFVLGMYTIYAALLAVGSNKLPFLFATYIPILSFQAMINYKNWEIAKVSLYIRVFFEEKRSDMHWSTLHCYKEYLKLHDKMTFSFEGIFRNAGAILLSLLTTILIIYNRFFPYILYSSDASKDFLSILSIFVSSEFLYLLLTLLLLFLCCWFNIRYFTFGKRSTLSTFKRFIAVIFRKNDVRDVTAEKTDNSIEKQLHLVINDYYTTCIEKEQRKAKKPVH